MRNVLRSSTVENKSSKSIKGVVTGGEVELLGDWGVQSRYFTRSCRKVEKGRIPSLRDKSVGLHYVKNDVLVGSSDGGNITGAGFGLLGCREVSGEDREKEEVKEIVAS
ncbi:hypothetical protein M0802_009477 [Mischocyttarus mexicanus]|nr:hypothetical protein M0802_009477 [Mischocyttarus mexicanus]